MQICRFAPAKINLSLHIRGRLADGYHELDSLFLPISFGDTVALNLARSERITVSCQCRARAELATADNLAARAARDYLHEVGVAVDVQIDLHKKVWMAAGLGGGSSDAAAVLRLLNRHLSVFLGLPQVRLGEAQLARLGAALGADVPFFLADRAARATGIGTELTTLDGVPALPLVLVNPNRPLATPAVYAALGLRPGERREGAPQPIDLGNSVDRCVELVHNDLRLAAERAVPALGDIARALAAEGVLASGMSGSGPTMFGIVDSPDSARRIAAKLSTIDGFSTVACHVLA